MKDLAKKDTKSLLKELKVLKEKLREISFTPAGNSKDSSVVSKMKKKIARILTIINNQ
ncbi:MAG: 50S ribosomal protein L29 [Candidatus Pacebacteria bacterium]|nr:50S ribosomal protein L29 [Candidatus Paceibacterota bacterium]